MSNVSTGLGIPINFLLASIVAMIFAGTQSGSVFESDIPIIGIAIALFAQEIILVQWLSRSANLDYEERLLGLRVSTNTRIRYLLVPFSTLIIIGIIFYVLSIRDFTIVGILRIIGVSTILTLCIDPLFGLKGKGTVALLGAGLAYLVVFNAGLSGHENTANWLGQYIPQFAGESIVVGVLTYLVLSCRWTYYRLFCYEEMSDWRRSVIDTFIPFTIMALGAVLETVDFIQLLYTGL